MRTARAAFASFLLAGLTGTPGAAQVPAGVADLPAPDTEQYRSMSGPELFQAACANCHAVDGTGTDPSTLAFSEVMPDFTACSYASRENAADWVAVAHEGGPVRGFSQMMPSFGGILDPEDLARVITYVRSLCADDDWPKGELNFPRAMLTEKAYPEDELVLTTETSLEGDQTSIMNDLVFEKRFGSRGQIEVAVPFGLQERGGGGSGFEDPGPDGWIGGLGDIVLGAKYAFFHSFDAGSIFALGGEVNLPTGKRAGGFGGETTVWETYASFGQALPSDGFIQLQGIAEFPTASDFANELVFRSALGRTFIQGEWGRSWTPMLEVQGSKELEDEEEWAWDLMPEIQVSLNTRQHILASAGVLFPLSQSDARETRLFVYLLWDWYDGGFFDGW